MKTRVVVGMSGGVDSAVSALLLKEAGYEVIGLFMRNWDSQLNNDIKGNSKLRTEEICPQEQDYNDALAISKKIGIKLERIDFIKEYWDYVFAYFLKEYKRGRTPNPDILCNRFIKFDAFSKYAFGELKADYIAMGHYAKTVVSDEVYDNKKVVLLKSAIDQNKDQTYFLSQLEQSQIAKTLFPLGDISKKEVRQIAKDNDFLIADKKDSTGICFIGERDFKEFLENYIPNQPGDILDIDSLKKLGTHVGTMYYTIGQSKGLNLGGQSERHYVCKKDVVNKIIYVCSETNKKHLFSDKIKVEDIHYTLPLDIVKKYLEKAKINNELEIRFRHRQKLMTVNSQFSIDYKKATISSANPFKAVASGQALAFYYQNICLGGGFIV